MVSTSHPKNLTYLDPQPPSDALKTKIPILGLFVPDLGMKAKRV